MADDSQKIRVFSNFDFQHIGNELIQQYVNDRQAELRFSCAPSSHNLTSVISFPDDEPFSSMADVVVGQPDPKSLMTTAKKLKWVHLTSAGYSKYDTPEFRQFLASRGAVMTNSSSVYDEPCAQHALSFLLAHSRRLYEAYIDQTQTHEWRAKVLRERSSLLNKSSVVLIVGFGAIGHRLAQLLAPFHVNVVAVRRSPKGDEAVPTFPVSELDRLLPTADHVINILPQGPATELIFNSSRFALMKPSAAFYNIGRGATVDQEALRSAIEGGRLSAAYLDVTSPEPLPPEHPLWRTPNIYITSHTAGGFVDEFEQLARHFLENFDLFLQKQSLKNRVA